MPPKKKEEQQSEKSPTWGKVFWVNIYKRKWCGARMDLDQHKIQAENLDEAVRIAHRYRRQWVDRVWSEEKGPYAVLYNERWTWLKDLTPQDDDKIPLPESAGSPR